MAGDSIQIQKKKTKKQWARKILQNGDFEIIQKAVADAEKKSNGEIVPMLVRSSTNIESVKPLLALILFSLMQILIHECDVGAFDMAWDSQFYWYALPVSLMFSFLIATPLSKILFLQRLLTSRKDQILDVHMRAEVEFCRGKFAQTKEKSAILLFVSLMERRAVVLADVGVAKFVEHSKWKEVVKTMTEHLGQGQFTKGMCLAITKSGEILSQHLPSVNEHENEISNQLILKD